MNKKEQEVYVKTLELFDGVCAICKTPYVQMHHIRYGGLYGGRKTYMSNVIPLCKKHHDLVHTNKNKYQPKLIEMYNKKINDKGEILNDKAM